MRHHDIVGKILQRSIVRRGAKKLDATTRSATAHDEDITLGVLLDIKKSCKTRGDAVAVIEGLVQEADMLTEALNQLLPVLLQVPILLDTWYEESRPLLTKWFPFCYGAGGNKMGGVK